MKEIFARRSVRTFLGKDVEHEKIERLLRAAMQAPSAGNQQPWEFLVIQDKKMLDELAVISHYSSPAGRASACILMLANTGNLRFPSFWPQDLSAATENILLEAVSLGLGAVWMGVYTNHEAEDNIRALFELPEHITPFALLAIGYPADDGREIPIRHDAEKIHYEQY